MLRKVFDNGCASDNFRDGSRVRRYSYSGSINSHRRLQGWTFRDLSEDIPKITEHWQREGLKFDGVYTGYLGSPEQAEMIENFVDEFAPPLVFIDPVMADNGKLYPGFDEKIVEAMRKLCGKADIITPNITEASLLTCTEYREAGTYDEDYIKKNSREADGAWSKNRSNNGSSI